MPKWATIRSTAVLTAFTSPAGEKLMWQVPFCETLAHLVETDPWWGRGSCLSHPPVLPVLSFSEGRLLSTWKALPL